MYAAYYQHTALTSESDSLRDTVERLQGEIFGLQKNKKQTRDYRQRETEMKSQIEEAKFNFNTALLSSIPIKMNNILDCGI